MHRSWAADKDNLQRSLERLAKQSTGVTRAPLWLLIFPEGTITSDDERAKSVRYAEKQGVVRTEPLPRLTLSATSKASSTRAAPASSSASARSCTACPTCSF